MPPDPQKPIDIKYANEILDLLYKIAAELKREHITRGDASLACYRGTTSLESIRDHLSAIEGACRNLSDPNASSIDAVRRLRNANRQASILVDRLCDDFTVISSLVAVACDLETSTLTTPDFLGKLRKKRTRIDVKKSRR